MKKLIINSLAVCCIIAMAFYGCQDLDVQNLNNPDEQRALATPGDIESLIQGSFLAYFETIESGTPNMSFAVMSDAYNCSWGNYSMSALSREPREEFDNTTTGGSRSFVQLPWFGLYSAISAASDGIRNIEAGTVSLGANNARAIAFGKFVQGLSSGWLAIAFDQGFILDENVDLAVDELSLVPYTEMMDAAIAQLEACITICNANPFDLPEDWINGRSFSNVELAQVAHSFIARYLVGMPRRSAERPNVNWSKVLSHVDQGITQNFGVTGNGGGRGDPWWNSVQWYSAEWDTWNRADYMTVGPSDRSSGFSDWLALAPPDRDEFIMDSGDLRIWPGTLEGTGDQTPGTQFQQVGGTPYSTGGYQKSRYAQNIFWDYRYVTSTASEAPMFYVKEHDFIRAEALLHTGGSASEIAALLNKTYNVNGGYDALDGSESIGSMSDAADPKPGASLWSIFKYEKILETLGTYPTLAFSDKRGWGDLSPLTMLHLPVPALDLETLQLGLYTHGGGTGDSAKQASGDSETLIPGNQ